METVLVTGVNGFVGSHLADELLAHELTIVGVGGSEGSKDTHGLKDYHVVDLRDAVAVKALDFRTVDAVVHLAGLAAVGPSFDKPLDYVQTNMGIEINLFEAAIAQDAHPKFLIISSGNLYAPKASLPLTETSPVAPGSPYAVSKLGQETLANYYMQRGFECVIARPFNHIGPGQGLGFIVPDLAKQVAEFKSGLKQSVMVGNLETERDYTDVRDIVRAYRLLLEGGKSGEIYNVCSGRSLSGQDILSGLSASLDKPLVTEVDQAKIRPSDYPKIYGSHDKLTQDTGWQPQIDIATTLNDVLQEWQAKLAG